MSMSSRGEEREGKGLARLGRTSLFGKAGLSGCIASLRPRCSRACPGSTFSSQPSRWLLPNQERALPWNHARFSALQPGAPEFSKAYLTGMSLAKLVSLKLALPAVLRLAGTC